MNKKWSNNKNKYKSRVKPKNKIKHIAHADQYKNHESQKKQNDSLK